MATGHQNEIMIAGMGRSGRATADYLESAGVAFDCCDDYAQYPDCTKIPGSFRGRIIKSPGMPLASLPVSTTSDVINDIELFLRMTRKPVVLVTGTNGKTTVVSLLEHILNSCGINAVACGNNGVPAMSAFTESAELYVLELSSYQLENLLSLSSQSSVVLNVGVDHTDRYVDMAEYETVKKKIYRCSVMPVFPVNEKGEVEYRRKIHGYVADLKQGRVTYSLRSDEIIKNGEVYCAASDISLFGRHNYLNVCASLALIESLDLPTGDVRAAIRSFSGLPHRMEMVCTDKQGRKWLNDSKSTNLHSLKAALSSQAQPVCLIMGGQGKGEDYSAVLNEYADSIGLLIAYGNDAELIVSAASAIANCIAVDKVSQAVVEASRQSKDVLFSPACASFDQYKDFNERGDDFKKQVKMVASC
jgi:UDP-N-acetylmuramoylalanine--D-glutamate ligase